jgi:hypothetical protein
MNCHIEYRLNGMPGHVMVDAEDSISALLTWLETIPQTSAVKAIVRVLLPTETVQ